MNKGKLHTELGHKIEENYNDYNSYFESCNNMFIFSPLKPLVFEIITCLILELNRAAITLTNFYFERLLKFALIESYMKSNNPLERDKKSFSDEIYNKSLFDLGIDCKSKELLTEEELAEMNNIRKKYRNGFAHANPTSIFGKQPLNFRDVGNESNVTDGKYNAHLLEFSTVVLASIKSKDYFDFVFKLMIKIESRIS